MRTKLIDNNHNLETETVLSLGESKTVPSLPPHLPGVSVLHSDSITRSVESQYPKRRASVLWALLFCLSNLVACLPTELTTSRLDKPDSILTQDSEVNSVGSGASLEPSWWYYNLKSSLFGGYDTEIIDFFVLEKNGAESALLTVEDSGAILVRPLDRLKRKHFVGKIGCSPFKASLSESQGLLAVLCKSGEVRVVSLPGTRLVAASSQFATALTEVDFFKDEQSLLISGADSHLYLWRFIPPRNPRLRDRLIERYFEHGTVVSSLETHHLGRIFFSADWDGTLVAWQRYDKDLLGGEYDKNLFGQRFFSEKAVKTVIAGAGDGITTVSLTDDGHYLLVTRQSGKLEIWSVRGFSKIGEEDAHGGAITSAVLGSGLVSLVTAGRDGVIYNWEIELEPRSEERRDLLRYSLTKSGMIEYEGVRRLRLTRDNQCIGLVGRNQLVYLKDFEEIEEEDGPQ